MEEPDDEPRCPYCKEVVRPDAVKCRWCGEFLKKDLALRARLRKRPPLDASLPDPSTILILGILGLVLCGVLGAFALTQGNDYLNKCRVYKIRPSGVAVAGRVLGIVSCVIMVVQAIALAVMVLRLFSVRS
jgi:hypothetical protein